MSIYVKHRGEPLPPVYACTECDQTSPIIQPMILHDCQPKPTPRPTPRQAALMRLATEAETLADRARDLYFELTRAGVPVPTRVRVRLAWAACSRLTDDLMAMAREDDQ